MEDQKKTIIYLGDGLGDFCPTLKLGDGDYVMPRKGFPVWDLICNNRKLVNAEICEWSDGEEFENLYSVDCKLETMPLPVATGHEDFPQALPVLH
ncbi:hypothetical protein Golax_007787 [Gossypium laxum]|uniref:Phosphatase n=1 Tax=Gossypium laxum TaxID=34288 RepID=A0A7J9A7W5_9ROSI|nr:hypothetical protein [Gossypium laxum]